MKYKVGDNVVIREDYDDVYFDGGSSVTILKVYPDGDYKCDDESSFYDGGVENKDIDHKATARLHRGEAFLNKESQVSDGGSLRYNEGKPEFSHLSPQFIMEMMKTMTKSNEKYPYLNYAKAQDVKTASDSLMRHFLKFQLGDDLDEESGCHHLAHLAVNAMIIFQNLHDFGDKVDNRYDVAKKKVQNGN